MRLPVLVLSALALFAGVGCASPDANYAKDPDTRIQRNGFSVLPPSGNGWMVAPAGQYGAGWGKLVSDTKGNRSTITVMVWAGRFNDRKVDLTTPAGLRETAVYQATGGDPKRYRIVDTRYSDVYQRHGTDCIDFDTVTEDSGNTMSWNAGTVLLLTVHGTLCRHPSNPEWGFNAALSDRHPRESASLLDDSVRQEARRCLDSVLLTALK